MLPPAQLWPAQTRKALRRALLAWARAQARALPWRDAPAGARDPYRALVAEVILQQTQAARGAEHYARFLAAFPTVGALSRAEQAAVLKAWEGCGYYARARNLHRAAAAVTEHGWPGDLAGWRALPGVGAYAAPMLASLTGGAPHAAVDGNIRRVLSRLTATHPTPAAAQAAADALLDPDAPGEWNEALMDLGALVCRPRNPRCAECPLRPHCRAFGAGRVHEFPAPRKQGVQAVAMVALLLGTPEWAVLEQRAGGRLGGLWGLPAEAVGAGGAAAALQALLARTGAHSPAFLGEVEHAMTGRRVHLSVYRAEGGGERQEVAALPLARLDHKALDLARRAAAGLFGTPTG